MNVFKSLKVPIRLENGPRGSGSLAETWRRVWGTEKISRPKFFNDHFYEQSPILPPKISDFFQSSTLLSVFCLSQLFEIGYNIYDPFPDQKQNNKFLLDTFFYSVRTLPRIR